jgi:hypothetical protein
VTHRVLAVTAALLGVLALFAGTPSPAKLDVGALAAEIVREDDHVTAIELAQWIRDRKAGLRVFDLRTAEEFDEYHVPTAKRVALDALVSMRFTPADTIVRHDRARLRRRRARGTGMGAAARVRHLARLLPARRPRRVAR